MNKLFTSSVHLLFAIFLLGIFLGFFAGVQRGHVINSFSNQVRHSRKNYNQKLKGASKRIEFF